ncbi:MAG: alpha/beta fold hydrolase [Candidatus Eisenbacteria bacterium]
MERAAGSWWPFGAPDPGARARVVALPFAGGGASIYRGARRVWNQRFDLAPLQLPGREGRIREAPYARMDALLDAAAPVLAASLPAPYALFGASMGALIAYELAGRLSALGHPAPSLLVLAASRAPHRVDRSTTIHQLPEDDFIEALRAMKGTPEEVLAHRELMALVLPTLRADFALCETYRYTPRAPLECDLLIFGGTADPNVPTGELEAWREMTRGACRTRIFTAGHFFLEEEGNAVWSEVARALGALP